VNSKSLSHTFQGLNDSGRSTLSVLLRYGGKNSFDGALLCVESIEDLGGFEVKIHLMYSECGDTRKGRLLNINEGTVLLLKNSIARKDAYLRGLNYGGVR
jgi:hypothetical protein